ncbi:MAG: TrkH family potassium uptake protein [Phycisphaerae bacterium]|jgi:trk system potassium uptake protein TrkH
MNLELRVVIRQLGLLVLILSALIAGVALFAGYERITNADGDGADLTAMLVTAVIGAVTGGILFIGGRKGADLLGQHEALLLVGLSWLIGAGLACLPFRLWSVFHGSAGGAPHPFDTFVNCYFEAMSGLTTTGATIVTSLETVPRSLLLWRSLIQWLGGLGIVVLFVAVLPMLGVGSRRIYRIEAPGPSPEGVKPRIADTARILWLIYCGLTVLEVLVLRVCGMTWFDAVCHTFTTLATGGFGTQDASIAAFPATAIQVVIIVFMLLAGVNFGLYHQLIQRNWRAVRKDPELRVYLTLIVVATAILTVSLLRSGAGAQATLGEPATLGNTIRHALFQTVSIQTTTGFGSSDFDQWGFAAKATLLMLMFVGGSAGSTGGGIKVVRILIAAKVMLAEIEHVYRPKVVRPIKIGRTAIDPELKLTTMVYVLGIGLLFALGTVLLMLFESGQQIDITSAASACAATLNNVGPGLGKVGPVQNYAWFSDASKVVMSVLMLLGRLEMFTVLVLFSPRFWRSS